MMLTFAAAVEGLAAAGYFDAGQDCTAATRMMIRDGIYDEFLSTMTESVRNTKTGYDPADTDILFGPINNTNQMKHVSIWCRAHPSMLESWPAASQRKARGSSTRRR